MEPRTVVAITPHELRRRLARLHPVGPVTESLERAMRRNGQREPWYMTQQEHLLGWLREYDGPGYYGRANWDRTAEFVYNHFNCAPGLLWIAEAAGALYSLLLKAKRAVLRAGPRNPTQSAAVRRFFQWRDVETLLNRQDRRQSVRRGRMARPASSSRPRRGARDGGRLRPRPRVVIASQAT
jgi:hypothetical protein